MNIILALAISVTMTMSGSHRIVRPVDVEPIEQDAEVVEVEVVQAAPEEIQPSFYDWVMYPDNSGESSFEECEIFVDKECATSHRLHTHGE